MGEKKSPTVFYHLQCAALAGAIHQYDFASEIKEYLSQYPQACVVEFGAGLSYLRRQIKNETNPWVNIDFADVIACREKYIPKGEKETNLIGDITNHAWMKETPFRKEDGIIILAAGVLHYLTYDEVEELVSTMAERFAGGFFVFDYVSEKGIRGGNTQVKMTNNATTMHFHMEDAAKELPAMSDKITKVEVKSYLEGYPVNGVSYSLLTKLYIRSKRDKYFVVRVEFADNPR